MSGSRLKHYTYWCPGETTTRCTELRGCYPHSTVDGVWTVPLRVVIPGSKLGAIWASSARLFDPHLRTRGVRMWTDGPRHVRRVPGNAPWMRRVPACPPACPVVPPPVPRRVRAVPPACPQPIPAPRPRGGAPPAPPRTSSRATPGPLLGRIGELRRVGAVVPHLRHLERLSRALPRAGPQSPDHALPSRTGRSSRSSGPCARAAP